MSTLKVDTIQEVDGSGFSRVLKIQQSLISSISSFTGASSTTYQTIQESTFVVAGTNTDLLIHLNINGTNSSGSIDRNFRMAYKVGSGSYTNINFNPNGTVSENMFSDIRGDDAQTGTCTVTNFLIDGTWSAGSTITVKLECVGEGTFNLNGAISSSDVRFGNGLSKFIFTEIQPL